MANKDKVVSITAIAIAQVAIMAVWFSASAIAPSLKSEFALSDDKISLLTSAVQAGFVIGALSSAFFGLADSIDPRRFIMMAGLIAAIANLAILWVPIDSKGLILLRFVTGFCMAGVYPVGMKMASSWANVGKGGDMGMLVGILVAALTLGSAAPHLFNVFGGIDWRFTIQMASLVAICGALLINLADAGPNSRAAPPFSPKAVMKSFTDPALRLANFGYLGHMWELYAMWAWLGVFLDASFRLTMDGEGAAIYSRLAAFLAIGLGGAVGCLIAGHLADRLGRTVITITAMTISGSCALLIGLFFDASPIVLFAICLIWGISVIADSAQFSASIAELSPPEYVGTMLTVQTAAGFLLTLGAIHLMPHVVDWLGWQYAFAVLAIGPFLGVLSMLLLRNHPDAKKLANGKK